MKGGQSNSEHIISVKSLAELEAELNRVYGSDERAKKTILILIKQELNKYLNYLYDSTHTETEEERISKTTSLSSLYSDDHVINSMDRQVIFIILKYNLNV